MANTTNPSLKKLGTLVSAVVIAVGVVVATTILTRPKITIVAPAGSTVVISHLPLEGKVITQTTTRALTTFTVSAGYYRIIVTNGNSKQLFYTTATTFQDRKYHFSSPAALNVALAARQVAFNVVRSDNELTYLDTTGRAIEQVDQYGTLSTLDTTDSVANLRDENSGNAQGLYPVADNEAVVLTNGIFYGLRNGRLSPLDTSGLPSDKSSLSIGTNPSQRSFVIGVGQSLYWYDSITSKPQKLFTINKRFDQLALGGNKILAYSTRMPDAKEDIRYAYAAYAIDPIIADKSTKTQHVLTNGPIVNASVSPDGTYATVEVQSSTTTSIYNIASAKKLYDIENPDTITPVWLDATHFTYGKISDVWDFNVVARDGVALGTLPNNLQPTSITYDSVDKVYYVTTYSDSRSAAIYSLSAHSVDPNVVLAAAQDTSSQNNNQFTFTYVNITQPTMRITTNVLSNNPTLASFRAGTFQSRQAALDYLKANRIDISKLAIVYDPANP